MVGSADCDVEFCGKIDGKSNSQTYRSPGVEPICRALWQWSIWQDLSDEVEYSGIFCDVPVTTVYVFDRDRAAVVARSTLWTILQIRRSIGATVRTTLTRRFRLMYRHQARACAQSRVSGAASAGSAGQTRVTG